METAQNNDPSDGIHWLEHKHKKILRVAFWAGVLSWAVLIIYVVIFISHCAQSFWILYYPWHIDPLSDVVQYPPLLDGYLQFALNISHAFATLFQGVVYALISRGVSLGLKMLVETDMNYKLSREEETHAQ